MFDMPDVLCKYGGNFSFAVYYFDLQIGLTSDQF
jgi:hypothetical protein